MHNDLLPELSHLVRSRLFAPWEPDDLGVSSSLTARAIENATGVDEVQLESWWRETGDLGDAAAHAIESRPQTTLVSKTLDIRHVYETLRGLAEYEGSGSQERRINDIAELLANADSNEGAGDSLILTAQTNKLSFVDRIVKNTGVVKAGFSGWAIEDSFKYRGEYDTTLVLSDHSDFSELTATVDALQPNQVYTHHGFADEFATHLEGEFGVEARSLEKNQSSLDQF